MKLSGTKGNALEISVVGYQFPDAEDLRKRYSWHMVRGIATQGEISWHFQWQALGCDESQRLGPWLSMFAAALTGGGESGGPYPPRLVFTEPNLAFEAITGAGLLRVELDLMFHRDRAHWRAGEPYVLDLAMTSSRLTEAATQWDEEVARYPDQTPRT